MERDLEKGGYLEVLCPPPPLTQLLLLDSPAKCPSLLLNIPCDPVILALVVSPRKLPEGRTLSCPSSRYLPPCLPHTVSVRAQAVSLPFGQMDQARMGPTGVGPHSSLPRHLLGMCSALCIQTWRRSGPFPQGSHSLQEE